MSQESAWPSTFGHILIEDIAQPSTTRDPLCDRMKSYISHGNNDYERNVDSPLSINVECSSHHGYAEGHDERIDEDQPRVNV